MRKVKRRACLYLCFHFQLAAALLPVSPTPADTLSPAFPFLAPFIYRSVKLSLCDHLLRRYYSLSSPSCSFHLGPVALGLLPLCLCCQALRCRSIRLGQIQRSFRRFPQGVKKANSGCLDQYVGRSVLPHSAETADFLKVPCNPIF